MNAAELPPIFRADSLPLERGNTLVMTHVVVTAQLQPRGTQHAVYVSHRSPSCFLPIFAKHKHTHTTAECVSLIVILRRLFEKKKKRKKRKKLKPLKFPQLVIINVANAIEILRHDV